MKDKLLRVKEWIPIYIFIICVVLAEVTGIMLDGGDSFRLPRQWLILGTVLVLAGAVPISVFLSDLFRNKIATDSSIRQTKKKNCFIYTWLICFICWVPVWLAYWPVLLNYDAGNQMSQNAAEWYSMQHPVIHTKMLGFFYWLGNDVFHSVNAGFALYAAFQMLILSGCIAYAINYLYKKNVSFWVCVVVMLWVCFWPTHPILAISTTKDVIFSAIFLLFFILSVEWLESEVQWGIKKQMTYLVVLVFLLLFRKNAIYAVGLLEIGLLISTFIQRKKDVYVHLKKMCIVVFAGMVICQFLSFSMIHVFHVAKGSMVEALSVPLQQITRTYLENKEELSEPDREFITTIIPEEVLEHYDEHLSDPIKDEVDVKVLSENMNEFMSLYVRLGIEFPKTYVQAFLYSTEGYWYLDDVSHSQIGGGSGRQSGYLGTNVGDMTGIEGLHNVVHRSLLPSVETLYEKVATDNIHQNWPIIRWLFAPAFYVWMIVLGTILMILNRKTTVLPALFLLLGYFITVLLGPCCLVRYVYPMALCAPVILILSLTKNKN